jgi:nucleotide-binding universal stress UspA family protein
MTEIQKPSGEILVALDGSLPSEAAGGVAVQIAQAQGFSVRGLYVVDETLALDPYADYRTELGSDRQPSSRAELLAWFEGQGDEALQVLQARCQAAGVPMTADLVAGGIPEIVLQEAEEASLLALGRRGRGHAGETDDLGHNFRTIGHRAHLPILAAGDAERPIRRLLLAYNGNERAGQALNWAGKLQASLPAQVAVVAVQESDADLAQEWLDEAQSILEKEPGDCLCLLRTGQSCAGIVAAAHEIDADLIVMGSYHHTTLMEWLIGSTLDRVLRDSGLAVLMV